MRKTALIIFTALLVAMICACTGSSPADTGPANALFFDNFTKSDSGWTRLQNSDGISDYAKGYYHILVNKASTLLLANPGQKFTGDVSVEVDARKISG